MADLDGLEELRGRELEHGSGKEKQGPHRSSASSRRCLSPWAEVGAQG